MKSSKSVSNWIDSLHAWSRRQDEREKGVRVRARLPQPQPWRDVLFLPLPPSCHRWLRGGEAPVFVCVHHRKQECFRDEFGTPPLRARGRRRLLLLPPRSACDRSECEDLKAASTGEEWPETGCGDPHPSLSWIGPQSAIDRCPRTGATHPSGLWCRLRSFLLLPHRSSGRGSPRFDALHPENRISLLPRKARTPPFFRSPQWAQGRAGTAGFALFDGALGCRRFSRRLPRRRWCLKWSGDHRESFTASVYRNGTVASGRIGESEQLGGWEWGIEPASATSSFLPDSSESDPSVICAPPWQWGLYAKCDCFLPSRSWSDSRANLGCFKASGSVNPVYLLRFCFLFFSWRPNVLRDENVFTHSTAWERAERRPCK